MILDCFKLLAVIILHQGLKLSLLVRNEATFHSLVSSLLCSDDLVSPFEEALIGIVECGGVALTAEADV